MSRISFCRCFYSISSINSLTTTKILPSWFTTTCYTKKTLGCERKPSIPQYVCIFGNHITSTSHNTSKHRLLKNDSEVLVKGVNNEDIGEMPYQQAKTEANEAGMKLIVDVATSSDTDKTVVRFEEKHSNKREKKLTIRETSEKSHLELKIKKTVQWLEKGHSVLLTIENPAKNIERKQSSIMVMFFHATKALAMTKKSKMTSNLLKVEFIPKETLSEEKSKRNKLFTIDDLKKAQEKRD